MASKAKPRGNRRSSAQAKKPATIDLDAKEVKSAAKQTTAKASADTKAQSFGRPNASEKTSDTKPAEKPTAKADTKTETKPEANKPTPQKAMLKSLKLQVSKPQIKKSPEGASGKIAEAATEKLIQLEQDFAGLNSTLNKITAAAAEGQDTSSIALSTAVASITKRLDLMESDLGTVATSIKQNPAPSGSETPETARLEALNASGIATRKQLVNSLDAVINSVQNPNAPAKGGSISDRFWANAQNLVSFRTSGPQEGDTPLAILSRVKAKVEVDDLSAAKAEWEKLPSNVRENGASWIAQLGTRIEAFALHKSLNQKLTAEAG
ncbi:hypothetical protein GQR58_004282 [Nymphon striatum]|nr:hypothetical protein GQR58_004282 [Nymphon striatum]